MTFRPQPGSAEARLMEQMLAVPADFPCGTGTLANLTPNGLQCAGCGRALVHVGSSFFHPDTPALAHALGELRLPWEE